MPQSELLTHDGYPAVKLENGSHMTEYSITVTDPRLNNGRPTNIPSLWERKIVDQDTAVDKAIQSKKEYKSFDTIKDAVSDSERKSNAGGANAPKEYNRGGTVRNLLATGGMMQEGGTTDPVSGNDVPTGSLKEEVRDDVPAQLSPGEFVFPADVTRYIGLDKLMQIREAAKEGLKEMESKGQMGNAEEVDGDAVDEDKFSTNIDEIIANLDGGDNSEPKKFAKGGSVNTSDYSAAPIKGFKMVQYEDVETKTVKYIPFVNGKALLPIPKGYTEKKAAAPVAPVAPVVPVEDQAALARAGGGADRRGGKSETDGEPVSGEPNDAGIEGFGDIQGGRNPNIARALGAGLSFVNPIVGGLVSLAGQYATKENNKKVAAANAAAIDASSLREMGFEAKDIKAAQDAAAKATLEGKSAKKIAEAAANAAALSADPSTPAKGEYGKVTSLEALIGITNGWNTTNPEKMKADAMPDSLKNQVPVGAWSDVVSNIKNGDTPEKAVEKAVAAYGLDARKNYQSTFDAKVNADSTTSITNRIDKESEQEGGIPAGKYADVVKDVQDGMTVKDAIAKANAEEGNLPNSFIEKGDQDPTISDRNMAVQREIAATNRREAEARDKRDLDVAREATNQATLNAAKEASDRAAQQAAKEAAERAAQQAEADRKPVTESPSRGGGSASGGYSGAPSGGSDVGRSAPGSAQAGQGGYNFSGGGSND